LTLRIQSFAEACRACDEQAFRVQHGGAFLLARAEQVGDARIHGRPEWTVAAEGPAAAPEVGRLGLDYRVLAVRRRQENSRRGLISVGRAENCDVVVADLSVSIYHAFFLPKPDGSFVLQDAGSKNGTFLDDLPVPRQGKGPPLPLEAGSQVRFGDVGFLFLPAAEFQFLVRQLSAAP
jgi:hypothetical protein